MSKNHTKITPSERDKIAKWMHQKVTIREIGRRLERSPGSICDELKRNNHKEAGYVAIHAQSLADKRKKEARGRHPLKSEDVFGFVHKKLRRGWSPEMIAGKLKKRSGQSIISHETIYRYVYDSKNTGLRLWEYLPWKRKKRKKKKGRGVQKSRIPQRVSIHERPEEINARTEFGHWEGDTVEGKGRRNGIHTEVERVSRLLVARKISRIASEETIAVQCSMFRSMPREARRSTTVDNGRENHLHYQLGNLGMKTYFADPYSSWQRGTNEYHNGLLRRYLPKGTDFDTIDGNELQDIVDEINNRPRKCLGWRTPKEVFEEMTAGVRIPS